MKTIRVLILVTDLEVGGAPLVTVGLAKGLAGYEGGGAFHVEVACLAGEGPLAGELRAAGVAVHALGAKGAWDVGVLWRLGRLLGRVRPDVLQCALMHANVAGRVMGRLCGVRRIVTATHTAEMGKRWHLVLEGLTERLGDAAVCVSGSVAEHMRRRAGFAGSRVRVIANGIEVGRFAALRREGGEGESRKEKEKRAKVVLFVGRLDAVKDVGTLLRAVAILRERGREVELVVAGEGPMGEVWRREAGELGLGEAVRFLGLRRDVAGLLAGADVFVQPSRWEGMPLAAMEAMAAGRAVVATRAPGLVDVVEDGRTGLLVAVGDAAGLAGAIGRVLEDRGLAGRLGAAGQERAWREFSVGAMVEGYAGLYRELMKRRGR